MLRCAQTCTLPCNFYPRPPRGGRRHGHAAATRHLDISIHALREEGDLSRLPFRTLHVISIHALREEGDRCTSTRTVSRLYFYPRPPRGGRQRAFGPVLKIIEFLSTPSARRATLGFTPTSSQTGYFYPRPPRGGRQQKQRQNLYFLINYTTFCTNLEEP